MEPVACPLVEPALPLNQLSVSAQAGQVVNTIVVTLCNHSASQLAVGSRSFRVVAFDVSG